MTNELSQVKRQSRQDEAYAGQKRQLQQTCQEFESYFLAYLLKSMRKTVPKSDLLGGGLADEIYHSMLDEKLAENIAHAGGVGIGRLLYQQLSGSTFQFHTGSIKSRK